MATDTVSERRTGGASTRRSPAREPKRDVIEVGSVTGACVARGCVKKPRRVGYMGDAAACTGCLRGPRAYRPTWVCDEGLDRIRKGNAHEPRDSRQPPASTAICDADPGGCHRRRSAAGLHSSPSPTCNGGSWGMRSAVRGVPTLHETRRVGRAGGPVRQNRSSRRVLEVLTALVPSRDPRATRSLDEYMRACGGGATTSGGA